MAFMKAAGKAILNSPKAIRKKLGGQDGYHLGHEQLDEDWYHSDDPINSGISFYVKYLGSAPVTRTHGQGSTDDAVKAIVQHAKHRGGKLQKVSVTVSSRFIKIQDVVKQTKLEELPLYRVSYCTVDPYYDKIFCYISRNRETKGLECHAFLCSKKSKAEAVTLTVAQAFNIAYERWQDQKKKKEERKAQDAKESPLNNAETDGPLGTPIVQPPPNTKTTSAQKSPSPAPSPAPATASSSGAATATAPEPIPPPPVATVTATVAQINIQSPVDSPKTSNPFARGGDSNGLLGIKPTMTKAVSLDYLSMEDEFDAEFTRLAEARSNPHLLDIGNHMNRATSQEEIKAFMREGDKSTVEDLTRSKSIDDLLMA